MERERRKAAAAAAAQRAAFEAQEARMAAELAQRTAQERALLQEAAQRARDAAYARRRCVRPGLWGVVATEARVLKNKVGNSALPV